MLDVIARNGIPVIVIGRESTPDWINSVSVDNRMGARMAIEHLYKIGHRRIAFIRGPRRVVDSGLRWKGICDFAKGVSLGLETKLVVQLEESASSSEGGYDAMKKLLSQKQRFTAVMAFDDMTAFGAIRALTQAGLNVPGQCSVVGFDDVAAAAHYNPPLTTISQSMEELGSSGVASFLHAVHAQNGKNGRTFHAVQRKVKPLLVVRGSTAAV